MVASFNFIDYSEGHNGRVSTYGYIRFIIMKNYVTITAASIQAYYDKLKKAATPVITMDSDFRAFIAQDDFYHDGEDDMRAYYFRHELFQPLLRALEAIWNNVGLEVDPSTLPPTIRISTGEAVDILKSFFPIKREMILSSINCPRVDFDLLKPGILEADESVLSQVNTDLSDHFKRLKLAGLLCGELHGHSYDDVLTALYREKIDRSVPNVDMKSFDEMRNSAKELVVDFWGEKEIFSASEVQLIEGIIKSDIFRGFREDCAVEYNRRYGQRPDRPRKATQTTPAAGNNEVLIGVRELAKYLHCGGDKALDIVASKILQKAGVAYRVGKTNQFDRKKLDAFNAAHPEALANVPKRQKKKK